MSDLVDGLLNSICHRGGPHAGVLPLCLRCSSVYAGALLGTLLEIVLRIVGRRNPGRRAFVLNAFGLALMGIFGLGGLYGRFTAPEAVKVFIALYFGSAIAFFAVSCIAHELAVPTKGRSASIIPRGLMLLLFASWAAALAGGSAWPVRALGVMAAGGLLVAFVVVNSAFALVILRRVSRPALRLAVSGVLVLALGFADFELFFLWRQT